MGEKWEEMSLLRRILVVILAVMIVGFGAATLIAGGQKGIEYRDTLLRFTQEGEVRRYAGRLDWKRAEFTVCPGRTVEYRWGDEAYGPYQIVEDPAAAPKYYMTGLEIYQNDRRVFRGGYHCGGSWSVLYNENGNLFDMMDFTVSSGGKTYDSKGKELTARDLHEPSLTTVARLGLDEAELTHRGHFGLYLLVTLLAAFNIFQICYPELMFRWSIMWHVQDPYAAEPSDWYILMERIEWVVLTGVVAVLYWAALTVID